MRHEHQFEEPDRVEADEYVYLYYDCLGEQVGEYVDYERDEVYEEWADCPATKVKYFLPEAIIWWSDYDTEDPDLRIERSAFEWFVDEFPEAVEEPLIEMSSAFNDMRVRDAADWLSAYPYPDGEKHRRWTHESERFSVDFELESEEVHH